MVSVITFMQESSVFENANFPSFSLIFLRIYPKNRFVVQLLYMFMKYNFTLLFIECQPLKLQILY